MSEEFRNDGGGWWVVRCEQPGSYFLHPQRTTHHPPRFVAKHPTTLARNRRRRGVALVMVLGALFLLSMVIFGLARRVRDESFITGRDARALDARALAFTGAQVALHPLTTVKTPALARETGPGAGYRARLLGEGGKINLNWLLVGEDPKKLDLFRTYLENKGLTYQEAQVFTDCLLDWIQADTLTQHLNGSKKALDGQTVPGRPFQDLSEVRRVVGNQPLTHQTGWEQDFTLYSQGPIDLQWAGEEVVGALPGVGLSRARQFVKQRRGPDGLDGTVDDLQFAKADPGILLPQLLGLSPDVYQGMVSNLIVLNDPTVRIVSEGHAYDVRRTIEVVARKQGVQPQILSWKEF